MIISDGKCIELSNCISTSATGCVKCNDGYILKDNKCVKCEISNCLMCTIDTNEKETCQRCEKGFVMTRKGCRQYQTRNRNENMNQEMNRIKTQLKSDEEDETYCEKIDPITSKCIECSKGYYLDEEQYCNHIKIDNCASYYKGYCVECNDGFVLTPDVNEIYRCTSNKMNHCLMATPLGCLSCIDGYYLDEQGYCLQCDTNCAKCIDNATKCITCKFGYSFIEDKNRCEFNEELAGKCYKFLPGAKQCAFCNDGYYTLDGLCFNCDKSCTTCYSAANKCTSCNYKEGYFNDGTDGKGYVKCTHNSTLTNCKLSGREGCNECENGYYVNQFHRCIKCPKECDTCANENTCYSCSDQYVLKSDKKCIHWETIEHCTKYDSKERKCSQCTFEYTPTTEGNECIRNSMFYFIYIGLPIIAVFIIIVIIIFGITFIIFKRHHDKLEERRKAMVNECYLKDAIERGIQFTQFGNEIPVLVNTPKIEFKSEYEKEISVDLPTEYKIMFANDSNRMIKLQYSSCTTTDKLEMKVHPPLVTIKKGRAVEIKVIAKPFCTCKFEGSVVFTVLDMTIGKSNDIEIPVELVTMLSTKLDFDELDCSRKLGEGSFGIVFLGNYRGSTVAIKKLKGVTDDEKQLDEFYKETAMLDKFRCNYIINYFGACFIPNKICMVTEFAQWGSVNDLMKKKPNKEDIKDIVRVKILLDAARGIRYLHENAILHRDIKPDNILVLSIEPNIKVNAKITDFGASRNVNAMMNNRTFTKGIGSPAYMAPEILDRKKYDSSADVYSFAITIVETMTWADVYSKENFQFAWDIADFVCAGKRVVKPEGFNDKLFELVEKCWKHEPRERLNMKEVARELKQIYEEEYGGILEDDFDEEEKQESELNDENDNEEKENQKKLLSENDEKSEHSEKSEESDKLKIEEKKEESSEDSESSSETESDSEENEGNTTSSSVNLEEAEPIYNDDSSDD